MDDATVEMFEKRVNHIRNEMADAEEAVAISRSRLMDAEADLEKAKRARQLLEAEEQVEFKA